MQYIDYLKKRFEINRVNYEAIQYLLEKKYIVWSNTNIYISYDNDYITIPFESLLMNLKQSQKHSLMYNGLSIIYNNKYIMNVKRNNITRKELFYILYILYAQVNVKISKKNLKQFFKDHK